MRSGSRFSWVEQEKSKGEIAGRKRDENEHEGRKKGQQVDGVRGLSS